MSASKQDTSLIAPWTQDQVNNLMLYQRAGFVHPYTCGNDQCGANLDPTLYGWQCPKCDYTQNWCHQAHADNRPPANPIKIAMGKKKVLMALCSLYKSYLELYDHMQDSSTTPDQVLTEVDNKIIDLLPAHPSIQKLFDEEF